VNVAFASSDKVCIDLCQETIGQFPVLNVAGLKSNFAVLAPNLLNFGTYDVVFFEEFSHI
jgi:hypothetical protein